MAIQLVPQSAAIIAADGPELSALIRLLISQKVEGIEFFGKSEPNSVDCAKATPRTLT
jgi:hypothetical protein